MESRKYFGGGTVEMVIAVNDSWVKQKGDMHLHERLEDGTLPLRQIFELDHAIDIHRKLYGQSPMKYISMHTTRLIKRLHDDLSSLRHSNGLPVVKIYKDRTAIFGESHLQGATIAFNIQKDRGGLVTYFDFEKEANEHDIYVRSGSLCNPGGTATYLGWTPEELKEAYAYGHTCSSPQAEYQGKPLGVVRASLGAMSTEADIERLVVFIREKFVDRTYESGGPISLPQDVLLDAPTAKNTSATVLHVSDQKEVAMSRLSGDSALTLSAAEQVALDVTMRRRSTFKPGDLLAPPPVVREISFTSTNDSVGKEEISSMKSKGSRTRRFRRSIGEVLRLGSRSAKGTHVW